MTQTLDQPVRIESAQGWLADFETALRERDIARASAMFATTSFWRDLISFTWNIATVENPDGVTDLLKANLDRVDPHDFALSEPEESADGVTAAWFTFETAVGRCRGLLRLVDEDGTPKAWTLLTTMYELIGHEEPRGVRRPMGAEHGIDKSRRTWTEKLSTRQRRWA